MAAEQDLRGDTRRVQGQAEVHPARRTAVCERRHSSRPCDQQDSQGHHRQIAQPGRLRRSLCSRLGLPRHADRARDRKAPRQAPAGGEDAEPVPRLCRRADRAAETGFPAPGRARRLGPSLPDHGLRQRGRRNPYAGQDTGEGLRLPRPEAGELVLRLRLGAGRGRSRVRGQEGLRHRCRLCVRRAGKNRQGLRPGQASSGPRLDRHLDHHALDHSGQSGAERAPGACLQPGRDRARAADPGRGLAGRLPRALRARGHGARLVQGQGAGTDRLPPPVLRAPGAGVSGRIRDARYRHRHRAQRARLRRRGLRFLPPLRHEGRADPHAGDAGREIRFLAAVFRRHDDLEGQPRGGQENRGSGRPVPL